MTLNRRKLQIQVSREGLCKPKMIWFKRTWVCGAIVLFNSLKLLRVYNKNNTNEMKTKHASNGNMQFIKAEKRLILRPNTTAEDFASPRQRERLTSAQLKLPRHQGHDGWTRVHFSSRRSGRASSSVVKRSPPSIPRVIPLKWRMSTASDLYWRAMKVITRPLSKERRLLFPFPSLSFT